MSVFKIYRGLSGIILNTPARCSTQLMRQQAYSMYRPFVKEPIYDPEKQGELFETGEAKKLEFIPFKAARPDQNVSVFHDELTSKFINVVMKKGKKELARNLVESAYIKIKEIQLKKFYKAKTEEEKAELELNPVNIFHKAIENSTPLLQLTPIKRGGATYQVPIPITDKHAKFMAMKWLIIEANEKERTTHFPEKLAAEILDAYNNTGKVVKRKQDLHKQCEANRAFAHYRWG